MSDTIFALASGGGRAGIAVFRISGPAAGAALRALTGRDRLPPPRRAVLAAVAAPRGGEAIDRGLALWFPAPASFTGEDVAELQLHGGRAVAQAMLAALGGLPGLRPAEPGEFTRRAFENGRLDLTAAEGLADLVAAETEAQRRQALRQLDGALGRLYDGWRGRLLRSLAYQEAAIDFADEDLPPDLTAVAGQEVAALLAEIERHLADGHRSERLRDGVSVVILGPPNVGKSSLLNALAQRDAAIVSATAGTTRDIVEVHLDLGGLPVVLADTAGLREAAEAIEEEGVRRALARAARADLKLVLADAADWPALDPAAARLLDRDSLLVVNKCDLRPGLVPESPGRSVIAVSVATGAGMPALLAALQQAVAERIGSLGPPGLTRLRHRQALETAAEALRRALAAEAPELAAEDLRLATRSLGRITGRVDVEDILDVVFRDFCIGK